MTPRLMMYFEVIIARLMMVGLLTPMVLGG
jgi:hypothetical protein